MRSIRFFLLAAWLCLSLGAFAQTTYYVAPEGTDEPTSGTDATPFKTIGYAISQQKVVNGDILQIAAGNYTEGNILVNKSLTITGLGQNVTITGISPVLRVRANGVNIQGLNISPETPENSVGILFESTGSEGIDNAIIQQNTISGFTSGIVFQNAALVNNLNVVNNIITDNTNGILANQGVQFLGTSAITENNLAGNGTAIVNNSTVPNNNNLINATANWWGAAGAPSVTLEINDVNRVIYSPWLRDGADDSDENEGFQSSFADLGVRRTATNLDALTEANDLIAAEGSITLYPSQVNADQTYEGITIDKNITFETTTNDPLPIESISTGSGSIEIEGPLKVNALVLGDGNIVVSGSNVLTLNEGASITENGSGQFLGEIKTEDFTLEAGNDLNLLGVSISSGAEDLSNITISRKTGDNAVAEVDNARSIQVMWDINVPNQENISPRTLTFSWENTYDGTMDFSNNKAVVWKRTASGEPWQLVEETSVSTTDNIRTVEVNNISSFSEWVITDEDNPLPVELTYFSASLLEPHVELNWETASEINSDFFAIERSENGKDFKEIGQLKAAGDSDIPLQYSYIDEQASKRFSGSVFYRLRTVDFDGSFEYSDITTVTLSDDDIPMITAFAREGQQSLKLFTRAIEPGDYRVWVTDLSGRKIFEQDLQLLPKESYEVSVGNLSQSIYLIRCEGRQLALSNKFRVEEID
ncbi:hypothetical protein OKW21_005492 [Catalinimonas alkaloidigena]|uniref:hypothetical protein n=1 Tax=Catalinimonas alkaloidigena TaxID=1075417 RepID=UPI00240607C1|nr:hypothetical protein [Catalinimonas alkaloidigena]MDF9800229.1 hypothetical protein [Catalinimonas alkaloidigena]